MDIRDGGMKSRKFWFAIGTSALLFVGGLVAASCPAFGANYETLTGGLLGVLAIYLGGNVGAKYVLKKPVVEAVQGHARDGQQPPVEGG